MGGIDGDMGRILPPLKNRRAPTADSGIPLIEAAKAGSLEDVKKHISSGAALEEKDKAGGTALFWAAARGYREIVAFLLDHKADINTQDSFRNTPLIAAADGEYEDVLSLLILRGADVNICNHVLKSALIELCYRGSAEAVRLLIGAGADTDHEDIYGSSARNRANAQNRKDILRLLDDAPAIRRAFLEEKEKREKEEIEKIVSRAAIIPAGTKIGPPLKLKMRKPS